MARLRSMTRLAAAGLVLSLAPVAFADNKNGRPRAVIADPAPDAKHPAGMIAVRIPSHGALINGVVYSAAGEGLHPTVLLLHGLPGNEQNLDLAQALRRGGYSVLTLHYRGSWGSGGHFSLAEGEADGLAAIAYLTDPKNAAQLHIDTSRITVVGHSFGGYVATRTAAATPAVHALALIAPWDIGEAVKPLRVSAADLPAVAAKAFDDVDGRLGDTMSLDLAKEIIAPGHEWRLAASASAIANRPILILTADRDSEDDKGLELGVALKAANAKGVSRIAMPTDHSFSDHRIALESAILAWMKAQG